MAMINSDTKASKRKDAIKGFFASSGSSEIHEHYKILSGLQTPTAEDARCTMIKTPNGQPELIPD
eukprot:scaffold496_cov69-Cylindrotheca_fusiformis.AAC.1